MSSIIRRLALLLAVLAVVAAATGPASAQDPIGGFFRSIFGGGSAPPPGPVPPGFGVPGQPGLPGQPGVVKRVEPKIVEQPKDADARVVAVIGDWQAANLAAGLQLTFADTPGIAVARKIKPGLSLVRDGEYDWPTQLPTLLAEGRTDIIVVMLGVNDRVTYLGPQGQKLDEVRSEKWEAMYRERAAKFLKMLKDTGKPVFWVGQAPVERPLLNGFLDYSRGIQKGIADTAGVTFFDVWNGFTDDEGAFAVMGADVEGKEKRLRSDDGVGFTRAGQRKLGYFVEQDIRSIVRDGPIAEAAAPEAPAAPVDKEEALLAAPPPLPPAPWKRVGAAQPLGDNALTGETDLAGPPPPVVRPGQTATTVARKVADTLPGGYPVAETPYARRVLRGEEIARPAGRVDDFRFDRVQGARGG